jgi:beta-fructofuranosidase
MVEHRPAYHFLPPTGWMNDPNGPIHWDGRYHLFYQANPDAAHWERIRWGHAVSDDLVHWEHLPVALEPGPDDYDAGGCFSGCAVDRDGQPAILYTGHPSQSQCLALGGPDLVKWEKHPDNPLVAGPPPGMEVTGFRDPYAWREGDEWRMVVGSGLEGIGGAALLYRSPDLVDWEYVHPLCVGEKEESGEMWECPNFFPLGEKHVLVVSPYGKVTSFVGEYAHGRFEPERMHLADLGSSFYAPNTFTDGRGRAIMWGWLKEARSEEAQEAAGWSGVMSLPRVLSLGPDGKLYVQPAAELEALRREHRRLSELELDDQTVPLPDVRGDCLELDLKIDPGWTKRLGLKVRRSPDGKEQTRIVFDRDQARLYVNRSRSSLGGEAESDDDGDTFAPADGDELRLRVFLDRSVIEVFAQGRPLASRIYPTRGDSLGVSLFAEGGKACLISLDAWQMKSVWG